LWCGGNGFKREWRRLYPQAAIKGSIRIHALGGKSLANYLDQSTYCGQKEKEKENGGNGATQEPFNCTTANFWCMHSMEHYAAMKRNELSSCMWQK
jgi:hypothetical protein